MKDDDNDGSDVMMIVISDDDSDDNHDYHDGDHNDRLMQSISNKEDEHNL